MVAVAPQPRVRALNPEPLFPGAHIDTLDNDSEGPRIVTALAYLRDTEEGKPRLYFTRWRFTPEFLKFQAATLKFIAPMTIYNHASQQVLAVSKLSNMVDQIVRQLPLPTCAYSSWRRSMCGMPACVSVPQAERQPSPTRPRNGCIPEQQPAMGPSRAAPKATWLLRPAKVCFLHLTCPPIFQVWTAKR